MDAGPATRVLVGVDGSTSATAALRWAGALAARTGLGITAVMAWSRPDGGFLPGTGDPTGEMHDHVRSRIDAVVERAGCGEVEARSIHGHPARVLLEAETDPAVAMVVLGTRGLGTIPGLMLGSVSRRLLWHTLRPLVLVPLAAGDTACGLDRVVIATDRSRAADDALEWGASLCADLEARVTVVRCLDPGAELPVGRLDEVNERAKEEIEECCEALRAHGVEHEPVVVNGDPRVGILEVAERVGAGLIVVGKRGASQFEAIGGTVSYLIRHSPFPLAVVPHPEPVAR
jgi:nucleotide-binding universal stress UspA family protein